MTWLIGRVRATKVLAVLGALAVVLCIFAMFLTEHGRRGGPRRSVVLLVTHVPNDLRCRSAGTRSATKFGAAGLVMAIVGGAIMPLIQAASTRPARRSRSSSPPSASPSSPASPSSISRPHPARLENEHETLLDHRAGIDPHGMRWQRTKANFSDPTDRLEVVSWWVSPSEHPAFEVLLNAFKAENPDVEVIDGAIAGGGGSNVQVALAARLRAGDPPMCGRRSSAVPFAPGSTPAGSPMCPPCTNARAWISHAADIARRGDLSGQGVGVPTGSHRGNVLWFNQRVLRDAGVAPPGPATPRRPSATILPKWRQAVERRCVLAARTGSPRRSCSRTLCWGHRPERMDQDQRRRVRLARITTREALTRFGQDRLPSRPECRRSHVGSGGEEVGDGGMRIPVDERFGLRGACREPCHRG